MSDDLPEPIGALPMPRRKLLAVAIADAIAEAVAARHLSPGLRLVETTLARTYSTSRVPVREALKILHTQGILTGGGHRGYRVADFTPEKIAQVFEMRLMLETILWRDTLRRWQKDGPDFAPLEAVIERMQKAAMAGDFRGMLTCDLDFHRAICAQAGNDIAFSSWNAIARHTLIIFNIARYRDRDLRTVVRRHKAIMDWLRAHLDEPQDEAALRALLQDHIQGNRSAIAEDGCGAEAPTEGGHPPDLR